MELTCVAYQGMIDALTNRSKLAESAFLSTAKHLAEAPDPYPILEATIAELASTEELTRLAEENARLRAQVEKAGDANALRIQLRQQETRSEDLIAQRVREREAEMAAQMDERERNWTDKEHDYQRQIAENREVVKELKIYQESASARLNEHDQKLGTKVYCGRLLMVDEGIAARLAELDIVVADLERSNLRIAEVERRNGELRSEIAALQSGKGTNAEERANKLEMNFRTLELEYDTVAQKIEQLQDTAKTEKESVGKKVKGLEREIARRGEEVNELKGRLRAFDDYDQIKRELEILRVCFHLVGVVLMAAH